MSPGAEKPLVGILMGSKSDWDTMLNAAKALDALGIPYEVNVMSAHRTPALVDEYVMFENFAKKEFPQRFIYRLASDGSLIPRNEGDGPSFEVRLKRIKCPGSDIKLRP